jgi:hypothetical protein
MDDKSCLSSFLGGLLAGVVGSVDVANVSIVHDPSRLPSESLVNTHRRNMGMKEDFLVPTFLEKETKEKKNRWEGGLLECSRRSDPTLAVQYPAATKKPDTRPGLGSRQCSDSMLLRPRRRPSSPNSPTELLTIEGIGGNVATRDTDLMLLTPRRHPSSPNSPRKSRKSEGIGGRNETQNMHRWASSSMSCVTTRRDPRLDPDSPKKPERRPGLGSRVCSDSMLLSPRQQTLSPNSPKKARKSEGIGGRNETQNMHRWASSSMSCVAARRDPRLDPASTRKPPTRPGLGSRQCSDSMLLRPRRRPSSPNSPTELLTIDGIGGKVATRVIDRWESSSASCVNEELTPPQANGAAVSKPQEDRRTLNPRLWNSMLSSEMEETTSDVDEEDSACSWSTESRGRHSWILRKQLSESALVNAETRGVRLLLPFQPTAIEELEEDVMSRLIIDSGEAKPLSSSQIGVSAEHFSDSATSSITGRDIMSPTVEDEESLGSLRTMVLEADGIKKKEDDQSEGLLWTQEIEMHCAGGRTEGCQLLQRSVSIACSLVECDDFSKPPAKNNNSEDDTGLGNQTTFLARCNDSLMLLLRAPEAVEPLKNKNMHVGRQSRTTPQAANVVSSSTAPLFEEVFSVSSIKNNSSEDLTRGPPGNQTKFLARTKDSLLLLDKAGALKSREKILRAWWKSKDTRKIYSDELLQRRAEGQWTGKILKKERMRRDILHSTLLILSAVDGDALKAWKKDHTTNLVDGIVDPPRMRDNWAA